MRVLRVKLDDFMFCGLMKLPSSQQLMKTCFISKLSFLHLIKTLNLNLFIRAVSEYSALIGLNKRREKRKVQNIIETTSDIAACRES